MQDKTKCIIQPRRALLSPLSPTQDMHTGPLSSSPVHQALQIFPEETNWKHLSLIFGEKLISITLASPVSTSEHTVPSQGIRLAPPRMRKWFSKRTTRCFSGPWGHGNSAGPKYTGPGAQKEETKPHVAPTPELQNLWRNATTPGCRRQMTHTVTITPEPPRAKGSSTPGSWDARAWSMSQPPVRTFDLPPKWPVMKGVGAQGHL